MIKAEWKALFKNKFMYLVFAALVIIPTLYNAIFLSSMWDPYGNLEKLPVAVVNLDQPAWYEDKEFTVGDSLVEQLKENRSLDFHFVTQEEAQTGLSEGQYYMVMTIPRDFSSNATTLISQQPKKMVIDYQTSQGHNYTASKMSNSAMNEIRSRISEKVTNLYAETILSQFDVIGDGMRSAVDGTDQLLEGNLKLEDGSSMLQDRLNLLATRSLTFSEGSDTFSKGLDRYISGVMQMSHGVSQLAVKTPELVNGIDQLTAGAEKLENGTIAYTDAVAKIHDGLNGLSGSVAPLPNNLARLNSGVSTLADELSKVKMDDHQRQQLIQYVEGVEQYLQAISAALQEVHPEQMMEQSSQLKMTLSEFGKDLAQIKSVVDSFAVVTPDYTSVLSEVELTPEQRSAVLQALEKARPETNASEAAQALQDASEHLQMIGKQLSLVRTNLPDKISSLQQATEQLVAVTPEASMGLKNTVNGLYQVAQQAVPAITQIASGTDRLSQNMPLLKQGVDQLAGGASQLHFQSKALLEGAGAVATGLEKMNQQAPLLLSGINRLNDGAMQLTENRSALLGGVDLLTTGAQKIADGSRKLAEGETNVVSGLAKSSEGLQTLNRKLNEGAQKISTVHTANENSAAIASPVINQHIDTDIVDNNGTAMAPYMLSVALFVGAIAVNVMYDAFTPRKRPTSSLAWLLSKLSVVLVMAILESVIVYGVLTKWLGLAPLHVGQTFAMIVAEAIAYMTLVTFFNVLLGKVGAFLMLIFLILQLAGSGGTYPLELSNSFFQKIHPYLPMSYGIDGLRTSLSIGGSIAGELKIFVVMTIVFIGLLWLFFAWKHHQKSYEVLRLIEE